MRRIAPLLPLLALLAGPAMAQRVPGMVGGGSQPIEKIFATRAQFATTTFGSNQQQMSKTTHMADRSCSVVRLWFANFNVGAGGSSETATAAARSLRASISYPAGTTPIQATFSAFQSPGDPTTALIPIGGLAYSDPIRLTNPTVAGQNFEVRDYSTGVTELYVGAGGNQAGNADWTIGGASGIADDTGNNTNRASGIGGANAYAPPSAITCVQGAYAPALLWMGDSISYGVNDINYTGGSTPPLPSVTENAGVIAKSAPMPLAFVNLGAQGAGLIVGTNDWLGDTPQRHKLLVYATSIADELGTNDIHPAGISAAVTLARQQAYLTNVPPGVRTFILTIAPKVTSAGNTFVPDQAADHAKEQECYNQTLRGNVVSGCTGTPAFPTGWQTVVDAASVWESTQTSGLWNISAVVTITDGSGTSGVQQIVSAAQHTFVSGDIGKGITCTGLGNAAGVYHGVIVTIVSGTTVTVNSPVGNTIGSTTSGQTCYIGVPNWDGVHPSYAFYTSASSVFPFSEVR